MGDTVAFIQDGLGPRLMAGRLCIDLCENIHLHYHDLRLEFTRAEWVQFAASVGALEAWRATSHPGYVEGDGSFFADRALAIAPGASYFPGRLRLERLANGTFHLHWHNTRLEFSAKDMQALRRACALPLLPVAGANARYVFLSELRVVVLFPDGQWRKVPIEESPNFVTLDRMDHNVHDGYVERQRKFHPNLTDITPTRDFIDLARSIRAEGFDAKRTPRIRIDDENVVLDGHHRVALLRYLRGDVELAIENGEVTHAF